MLQQNPHLVLTALWLQSILLGEQKRRNPKKGRGNRRAAQNSGSMGAQINTLDHAPFLALTQTDLCDGLGAGISRAGPHGPELPPATPSGDISEEPGWRVVRYDHNPICSACHDGAPSRSARK
jgi:hypothetical protein